MKSFMFTLYFSENQLTLQRLSKLAQFPPPSLICLLLLFLPSSRLLSSPPACAAMRVRVFYVRRCVETAFADMGARVSASACLWGPPVLLWGLAFLRPPLCVEILATRSWLPDPGYLIRDTRSWLPDSGYHILATTSWLPHPGCQILATSSW